ncbi:MAG: hypothetical protein L0219_05000 [Phycisphaerales bacterium]|nr:hypothetical protein [Phycisphaerales bacterium]
MFEDTVAKLFFAMLALFVGSLIYGALRHGGFKGAMFGAKIERTVGQVACNGVKFGSMSLKVHKLSGSPERVIGIEMVAKTFASYDMMPMTLLASEAKKLATLLEAAVASR